LLTALPLAFVRVCEVLEAYIGRYEVLGHAEHIIFVEKQHPCLAHALQKQFTRCQYQITFQASHIIITQSAKAQKLTPSTGCWDCCRPG